MKFLRPIITTVGVCLVLTVGAMPSRAGGSIIHFPRWVVVGRTVTAHGLFGAGQQASVSEGPWFATLESEREGFAPIRLGEVHVDAVEAGWRATVTFVVPDVPIGSYEVWVANDRGDGVGDLVGGWTVIAHTPTEGRLLSRMLKLTTLDRSHTNAIESLRERRVELRRELGVADDVMRAQGNRLAASDATVNRLRARLDAADRRPIWPVAVALLGAGVLVVAAYEVGRRTGYATRTLVTGASRSWTENHDEPESAEPKTSPLVAPK